MIQEIPDEVKCFISQSTFFLSCEQRILMLRDIDDFHKREAVFYYAKRFHAKFA